MADHNEAHVVVAYNSLTTSLLLRQGSTIDKSPITGQTQVVTTGDTAERADQRTPQVIWTDQRGGVGTLHYTETEGLTTCLFSTCDLRFPGMITLPPKDSNLDSTGLVSAIPSFVEYLGATNAYVIAWAYGNASTSSARRNSTSTTWNAVTTGGTGISNLTGFAYFNGRYCFATTNSGVGLYTSTDGITWADSAKAKACIGLATHDNKIWTFNSTGNTLDWATDPTAVHGSWGTSTVLYLHPNETVRQVVAWRDVRNRAAMFLVTTRRIIWYDEDADAFLDFQNIARLVNPTTAHPRLAVSPRDGSAILTLYDTGGGAATETVYHFSGVTTVDGPNRRGGLPDDWHVSLVNAVGNSRWMFFAGTPRGVGAYQKLLVLNEQGGWSSLYSTSAAAINGIGYGDGKVFMLTPGVNVVCVAIAAPDNWDTPLSAAGTYYASGAHAFAFTDGGTPNMDKQALWVTVQALDHTDADKPPGLPANTTVQVYYSLDQGNLVSLGTLTSASTFPAVLPFNSGNGVAFKQIRIYLVLATTDEDHTPIVTSTALAYIRQEEPRYSWALSADLRDIGLMFSGLDRAQLLARIDSWTQPGAIVRLDIAGGDWSTDPAQAITIANCTVSYRASVDPDSGVEQLGLRFDDVSPPASG